MPIKMINGFNEDKLFILYAYLCRYEHKIKGINTLKELTSMDPNLHKLESLISSFSCHIVKRESMPAMGLLALPDILYMTNSKNSKVLSFLTHIRNSIAHGQIMKEKDYIHIIDYSENKNTKEKIYTARGKVEIPKIEAILDLVIENVEL